MQSSELPPRYDAETSEQVWSEAWSAAKAFQADPEAPGEAFSIVIPPPNITGRLHMGHALNNTMQDLLARYKRMDGFNVLWVPGTDHAGIATQWVVRRQIEAEGLDMRALGREAFLERVWKWKAETQGNIRGQLNALGASCDWSRERFTLDEGLQRAVTEHFVRLYEQGLIYRGERMIHWDPVDCTAVSDLEVEHKKDGKGRPVFEEGELYAFAYPLADGSGEIVVATTRPETILGDVAVAVHPQDERYQHLIGKTVRHPLVDREIPILADDILVDPAFGTGAVKITPAHDFNDFAVGQRHNLPMITIFDAHAAILPGYGEFSGLDRFEARKQIKSALAALGLERGCTPHPLAIGRSQRSGAILEPMLSTQWFVHTKPLAAPALAAVELGHTRFHPEGWENTYFSWMHRIEDWCISRQLWWGHRIPAYYDAQGHVYVARSLEAAALEAGVPPSELTQDEDTLDTWFSSALWPFSVMGWPNHTADLDRYYPTSVLITGFDIIFFWVARMMMAGIHFTGVPPFRDIIIHTLVRDENREKMSKTKGNVVDPLEVIGTQGADAFRFALMALSVPGADIVWNPKRVEDAQRFLTKIWQALRYTRLHLDAHGYAPELAGPPGATEAWLAAHSAAAVARVREAIESFRFHEAALEMQGFVWNNFCDWYLEFSKTVLYGEQATQAQKQRVLVTLVDTLDLIARLLHPIMPFFSEALFHELPGRSGLVALAHYPKPEDFALDASLAADVDALVEVIKAVRNVRGEMEIAPRVGLTLHVASDHVRAQVTPFADALKQLAGVDLSPEAASPVSCAVTLAEGSELRIPIAGVVDLAVERKRLESVIAKTSKDAAGLRSKLDNQGFVTKAPPEVLREFRDKLQVAEQRLELATRSLATLEEEG